MKRSSTGVASGAQGELGGMPERDACGVAAIGVVKAAEGMEAAKVTLTEAKKTFIDTMRKHKRLSIVVDGRKLCINHKDAEDQVLIKRVPAPRPRKTN